MYGRGTDGRHQSEWSRGGGTRGDGPPDSKYRKQVSDEAEEEVRELFQKKFHFVDERGHYQTLPKYSRSVCTKSMDF